MRPVSIAWGGVLALALTGAAAAGPLSPQPLPVGGRALNPQPLPPGSLAQERQVQSALVLTACASGQHAGRKAGGANGHAAAASHGSGGGSGKAQTACASGKR